MRIPGNNQVDVIRAVLALKGSGGGQTQNPTWTQPAWFIDPSNRTGLASDGNDGKTALTPVLTWNGGVIAKYGTLSPILRQDTTWTFLSPTPAPGLDPIVFTPIVTNNATCIFQGTFTTANKVGSGILAGVVAKNYAAGQLPTANLSSAGPVGVNQLVINTTAGKASAAWTFGSLGGGLFTLSQPLDRTTVPLTAPAFSDGWANGDTFDVFDLDRVEFAQIAPIFGDDNSRFFIQQLGMSSFQPASPFYWGEGVVLQECRIDRRVALLQNAAVRSTYNINTIFTDTFGLTGGTTLNPRIALFDSSPSVRLMGGFGALLIAGAIIDGNFYITPAAGSGSSVEDCLLGTVNTQSSLGAQGSNVFAAFFYDGPRFWGPGQYQIGDGHTLLTASAVSIFLNTAAPKISIGPSAPSGGVTAFTATAANPSVINGNIPITPAAIDAAADPGGVGMFVPGIGGIGNR